MLGRCELRSGSFSEEIEIEEAVIWNALYNDLYCYCTVEDLGYYSDLDNGEAAEGQRIVFTPSQALCENLLNYFMYMYMDDNTYEKFLTDSTHELRSCSGVVVLDGDGQLVSMEFTADISRTAVNGSTVDGTLSYSKTVKAVDEDVTLPGEAPEELLTTA